jgi:hypothetical protein
MCQNVDLQFLLFIAFLCLFFSFHILCFAFFAFQFFIAFPPFSDLFFIAFLFLFLFHLCFISVFSRLCVSSLAYPNLLETKMLGCCCC